MAGYPSGMRYDLAIFDFDGTLADSFPFFARVHNELARAHGFREVAADEVAALRGLPTREIVARSGIAAWRLPIVARDFTRRMQEADEVALFPGAADVLHRLADTGVALALVSSNSRENALRVLGPELAARFAHVECGMSMFGKATRLTKTMRALGVRPARTIYVGDQVADGDAARAAGAAFGAVDWGYALPEALAACEPALRFAAVAELHRIAGEAA